MASSNEKVVYAFQIFEKRLVLYIFNKKPEKKNVCKYSITNYPNQNCFS